MTDTTLPDYAALAPKVMGPTPAPAAPVAAPAADAVPDYKALAQTRAAQAVRNTMQFAPAANPDEEAKYRHLAGFIGAPLDTVRADPAAASARASLLATDADRLAAQSPTTAATLSDPSNARMLHDQIPNVAATEGAVQALAAQPQRSVWADIPSAFTSTANKIGAAATRAELAIEPHLPKWLQASAAEQTQNQGEVGRLDALARGQAPQTLPGQVVAGLAYAPFAETAPLVVAGAEGNARESELLAQGADPDAARLAAASEGGLQGLIQMLPLGHVLFGQGVKALGRSAAGATLKAGAAGAAQSVVSDTATQQILAGVGEDDLAAKYAPTVGKALEGAAFMGALHLGTQTVMGAHAGIGKAPEPVGAADAQQATATMGILQKLGELATTGKFRERDADAFHQFVADVADHTGAPDLYVDARKFAEVLDQGKVSAAELAARMPDVAAQMREGLQSEGMVKIPLADYAQHIAGGPLDAGLLPHFRTDPAGMSFDEAQQFYQGQVTSLTPEAQALAQADKATADANTQELQGVHDTVLDQLTETGRYKPEVAKAYAALTRDFYGTTAGRTGMSPAELFAKHPLRIQGEDIAGEHLDQSAERAARAEPTGKKSPITGKPVFDIVDEHGNKLESIHVASTAEEALQLVRDRPARRAEAAAAVREMKPVEAPAREQAPHSNWKIYRDAVDTLGGDDDYLYHVTSHANAKQIIREGLKPGESANFGGAYVGHSAGKVFVTERSGVNFWKERIEQALFHNSDKPSTVTVVRVPKSKIKAELKPDDIGTKDAKAPAYFSPDALNQSAYHGTPHEVDKFTTQKIGTGEGAQAYGWGMYFAGNKDVADYYRDALSTHTTTVDGKPVDKADPRFSAIMSVAARGHAAALADAIRARDSGFMNKAAADKAVADIEALKGAKIKQAKNAGNLYRVEVPDDSNMLDYDARLKDQPESVQAALEKLGFPAEVFGVKDANYNTREEAQRAIRQGNLDAKIVRRPNPMTGKDVYEALVENVKAADGGPTGNHAKDMARSSDAARAASEALDAAGIPGLRYLDQNSRGAQASSDTRNYVVFHDNHVGDPEKLNQSARGTYSPETNTLTVLHSADLSTYLHELGHHFLETYARLAAEPGAPEGVVNDFRTLMAQHGSAESAADWLTHSLDERRDVHENFARGFEAYLMEGKAPTVELQSLFGRFRSWLVQVYKSLSALRVQLTPEVRGVMDRMVASQAEIEAAQKVRGMGAMFDAKPEGMSAEDFKRYQELGNQSTEDAISDLQARGLRDMKWLSNAKGRAMRELQRQADTERAAIREEVERAYDENPATQAKQALAEAEKAHEEHPTSADFNAQLIAEQNGFETVESMHRAIDELGDRKTFVTDTTDQRMLEEHGDLVDPRSVERAAEAAVHNAARTRFIATELKGLAKAVGSASLLAKAARAAADSAIAAKRVRDLRPDQYSAAEGRASRASTKAFMKGDTQEAAIQKRAQLLSNALARSATEAAADIAKSVEYLKRFDKASVRDRIDVDYRDQIDAILAKHDLRTSVTNRALDTRTSIREWVEEQQALGNEPMIPQDIVDEANTTHYKDMTVESFRGLVDAVKSIEHLGKAVQKIRDGNDARDFRAVVDEAVAHMATLPQRAAETNRGLSRTSAKWLDVKAAGRNFDSSLLKMEQIIDWLDAHDSTGVFNRVVYKRIAEAQTRENDMRTDMVAKLHELAKSQPKGYGNDFDKKLTLDGLIDTKTGKTQILLKRELLSAALNSGNESNYQKMLAGEKWSDKALQAAFDKHLTKADWDYVQGVLHAVNHLWPEIAAMERRLGNTSPTKIEARPIVTPHGTYEGGYYPAVYDPLRAFDVEQNRQRADGKGLMDNNYQKATTSKGHTKERSENYARPILLSLDVIPRHMTQVIHDIAYREALMDADRFLANSRVREGVENVLGREYYKQFRPWLQALANDKVYDSRGLAFWDKAAHWARTTTTIVGLGYRVSTMMIHGATAASNSVGEIGARWMLSGTKDVLGTPTKMAAARDFIFERSGEMRNRMNEVDRDIRDQLREMEAKSATGLTSSATNLVGSAKRGAFYGIAMLDFASAMPTWMGAYNKGLHEGLTEEQSVYAADKAVRNAHGGTGTKDLAAIQRGPEFQKLFTMFYSFWNHFYNRQRDIARTATAIPGKVAGGDYAGARRDFAMVLARSFFYFIAPQLLHAALKPPAPGQQDEEEGWVHWAAKEIALGLFSGVPVVRDVANAVSTGRDYQPTPAVAIVKAVGAEARDVSAVAQGQPASDRWLAHAVQTAGYVFGLPTGQASNAVQYLWDVGDGKQDPQGLADWWHGLKDGHQ